MSNYEALRQALADKGRDAFSLSCVHSSLGQGPDSWEGLCRQLLCHALLCLQNLLLSTARMLLAPSWVQGSHWQRAPAGVCPFYLGVAM